MTKKKWKPHMHSDEAAVVKRIAELRLIAEGDGPADVLQAVLDEVLLLKTQAEAALAT